MRDVIVIEILAVPAEQSRGRHNPRVVKRKMSNFPTKARAAPPPRQVFRYDEHIRIVAPVLAAAIAPPRGEAHRPATAPRPRRRIPRATGQPAAWRAHVYAWRASNLSRRAYCRAHGLTLRTFNTWVARLRHTFRRSRTGSRHQA
jgi:hypothetical protein